MATSTRRKRPNSRKDSSSGKPADTADQRSGQGDGATTKRKGKNMAEAKAKKSDLHPDDPNPDLTQAWHKEAGKRGRGKTITDEMKEHAKALMKHFGWNNGETADYLKTSGATIGNIVGPTRSKKSGGGRKSAKSSAKIEALNEENERLKAMLAKHMGIDLDNLYPDWLVFAYAITDDGVVKGIGETEKEAIASIKAQSKGISESEIITKEYELNE